MKEYAKIFEENPIEFLCQGIYVLKSKGKNKIFFFLFNLFFFLHIFFLHIFFFTYFFFLHIFLKGNGIFQVLDTIKFESDINEEPHFYNPQDKLPDTRLGKTIFVGDLCNVKDENELMSIFSKFNPINAELYKNPNGEIRNWYFF